MAYQDFSMDHQWLPFTPNRSFKKDPRIFVAADGMYFTFGPAISAPVTSSRESC